MSQPKRNKTAFLSLRLTPELKAALQQQAQATTRTAGAQALHYIKQGLKNDLLRKSEMV